MLGSPELPLILSGSLRSRERNCWVLRTWQRSPRCLLLADVGLFGPQFPHLIGMEVTQDYLVLSVVSEVKDPDAEGTKPGAGS